MDRDEEADRLRKLLRESLRLFTELRVTPSAWRGLNAEQQRAITEHGNALEREFKAP